VTKPTGRPVGRPPDPKPKRPQAPKPRGRPKGSPNKPGSIAAFVTDALLNPPAPPEIKKRAPRGAWVHMTPEQRTEYAHALRAARSPDWKAGGATLGRPAGLTDEQHQQMLEAAMPEAKRIIKTMTKKGQLPELDPRAEEAMTALLVMLRAGATAKDRVAIAKTILDFTMSKPTAKTELTVKSAEDLLDDLADAVLEDEPEDEPEE